jgi:hypothetical protein
VLRGRLVLSGNEALRHVSSLDKEGEIFFEKFSP